MKMSCIKQANMQIHDKEAWVYDEVHTEVFNKFEQRSFVRRLSEAIMGCNRRKLALDIGCGTGNLTSRLIDSFEYVVGSDISKNMLKKCRTKNKGRNVDYVLADGEHLPFRDHMFDFIGMYSVLHHLPSPYNCLKEVYESLKSRGLVYIDHEPNLKRRRKVSYWVDLFFFMAIQYRRVQRILSSVHLDLRNRYYSKTDVHVKEGFSEEYLSSMCRKVGFSEAKYCFHHNFSARFSQLSYPLSELSRLDSLLDRIPVIKQFSSLIFLVLKK